MLAIASRQFNLCQQETSIVDKSLCSETIRQRMASKP